MVLTLAWLIPGMLVSLRKVLFLRRDFIADHGESSLSAKGRGRTDTKALLSRPLMSGRYHSKDTPEQGAPKLAAGGALCVFGQFLLCKSSPRHTIYHVPLLPWCQHPVYLGKCTLVLILGHGGGGQEGGKKWAGRGEDSDFSCRGGGSTVCSRGGKVL